MRFSLLMLLLLAGCATTGARLPGGMQPGDTLVVKPVRNLAGVPLKVPAIYFGDAVGKGADLDIDNVDLALLAEAAVYSRLGGLGYEVGLDSKGAKGSFEIHAAITELNMTEVRQTGRFHMAMTVMLVDAARQIELTRGSAAEDFQLLDVAPDEAGIIGSGRFIEQRLQVFTEGLAREALDSAGF